MTTSEDLRRRTAESRVRLAAAQVLRDECALIARQTRQRLEASRLLLDASRTPPEV